MEEGGKMNRIHAQEARKSKTAQPWVGGLFAKLRQIWGLDPPELAGILPGGPAAAAAVSQSFYIFARELALQNAVSASSIALEQTSASINRIFSGYPGAGAGTADPAGGRFPPVRGRDQRYQKAETGRAAAGASLKLNFSGSVSRVALYFPRSGAGNLFRRLF